MRRLPPIQIGRPKSYIPVRCQIDGWHLLHLGAIMKHVDIPLLYLYRPPKSTKTESVCDCRIMVWLCSHFCSSWQPHFLVPHLFLALLLVSENTVPCLGYRPLCLEF